MTVCLLILASTRLAATSGRFVLALTGVSSTFSLATTIGAGRDFLIILDLGGGVGVGEGTGGVGKVFLIILDLGGGVGTGGNVLEMIVIHVPVRIGLLFFLNTFQFFHPATALRELRKKASQCAGVKA